jgi:hypothetical protein
MGWGGKRGTRLLDENWYSRMDTAENVEEGEELCEKRKPRWIQCKTVKAKSKVNTKLTQP